MDTLYSLLIGGGLIVGIVGGIKWFFNSRGKPLKKGVLRWIAYGLSIISAVVATAVSGEAGFADPTGLIQTMAAAFGLAETIYRTVTGKLNLTADG